MSFSRRSRGLYIHVAEKLMETMKACGALGELMSQNILEGHEPPTGSPEYISYQELMGMCNGVLHRVEVITQHTVHRKIDKRLVDARRQRAKLPIEAQGDSHGNQQRDSDGARERPVLGGDHQG